MRHYKGLGTISLRIPIGDDHFIYVKVEGVDIDIPLLLGLEFTDQYRMIVDVTRDMLFSDEGDWSLPLSRKHEHL